MKPTVLTCDRTRDGICRVAIWRGGDLVDVWGENPEMPDLRDAQFAGRIVRVAKDGKGAWADIGLPDHAYIDKALNLRAGDLCRLRIRSQKQGTGKGADAVLVAGDKTESIGLIEPPPPVWARALMALKGQPLSALRFADRQDHAACAAYLAAFSPEWAGKLEALGRENPHPDLADRIQPFLEPRIPLAGGGALVLQETEALVAIDVDGGNARNPLAMNLVAAQEIARQIRIRNLSGIIIVDALKMQARADGSKLLNAMKRATAEDTSRVDVFSLTKLGLVEMTRRARGASLASLFGCGG